MSAARGQPILYRVSSTRTVVALVTAIVSGDTVNLVAFTDSSSDWPGSGVPATTHPSQYFGSVAKGTGVGEWQEAEFPASILTAIAALESSLGGRCAVPAAGETFALELSTPRRPSTTRPTRVTVHATISLASALLAAQSATVEMQADSSATPSTTVAGPLTAESGVGNVGTLKIPITLTYDLPPDHYYEVVKTSGAGTIAGTVTESEL